MSGNSIPVLSARQFSSLGLINLQRISMSRCGITQVDGHAFGGLTNMVELDLSSNQLQEVSKSKYILFEKASLIVFSTLT